MSFQENYNGAGTTGANNAEAAVFQKFGSLDPYQNQFQTAADDFDAQFQQLVGRPPNTQERSAYFGSVVGGSGLDAFGNNRGLELQQLTQNYLGSHYADEANQLTQKKLADQQGQANSLAELFRTQGNTAIDNVQNSLLDFQSKLFDKIRPNLITSLQSQGLLNTGGLNQALAGQQADLANAAGQQVADLRYQNDQGANAIAFGGASAPYQFQQQQLMNNPAQMQQAAGTGLQNSYNTMTQNLNYQNQAALLRQQFYQQAQANAKNTHGFWGSVGNSFAPSFGAQLGQNAGNFLIPNYTSTSSNSETGKSSTKSGAMALFG